MRQKGEVSTRLILVAAAFGLAGVGCSGGDDGPTGPGGPAATTVAGHYAGPGTFSQQGGTDCKTEFFENFIGTVECDVRQVGTTLDMNISIIIPQMGFGPLGCDFDGTLTGTTFSSTLRECTASAVNGLDPTVGIECSDGSTRNATAINGSWSGSLVGGRHTGTIEVNFDTVDPATGDAGMPVLVHRDLDLTREL